MQTNRYLATAIAVLMLFSALPLGSTLAAWPSGVLYGKSVGLHGPYLNEIDFSVISSDSTLYSSLAANTIQGPEWVLSAGSFASASSNTNLYANTTVSAGFYYYAFNGLRPITNSSHFHKAIQYLTNYAYIQGTVCGGLTCVGTPELEYSGIYGPASNPSAYSWVIFSLQKAVDELKLAGLFEGNTTNITCDTSNGALCANLSWHKGSPTGPVFAPNFFYRSDSDIRAGAATDLIHEASLIGFTFNAKGVTGSEFSTNVYTPAVSAVISPGKYIPETGYNSPPKYNYTMAEDGQIDSWDMGTAGWIGLGSLFNYDWSFMNSQNGGTTSGFIDYYNATMDFYTNKVQYATTITEAAAAAAAAEVVFAQNLPYVIICWTNQDYAVYLNGWTGYVPWPGAGPMTTTGAYYSFLNLHPTNKETGGTFSFALHQAADGGFGLDPLYVNNWVWQADIWASIYDAPLNLDPVHPTTSLAYVPWMGPYTVESYSGQTGSGAGWFEFQTAQTPQTIHDGTVITFNFYHNITFFDHVPVTAYDMNFSLWVTNLAGKLPDSNAPTSYGLSGPLGLVATYIPANDPYQIKLYINSSSVWNLAYAGPLIFPLHIWKYFNPDGVSGASAALDTTLPFGAAAAACNCLATGVTTTNAPLWLKNLPNLEVSNGPFMLKSFDPSTGSGILVKNVNYYRAAWWAGAPEVAKGTSHQFQVSINESMYNSGSSSLFGVAGGQTGIVPITNATGTVTILKNDQPVGTPITLTGGTAGKYMAAIDTSSLQPGLYELVVNATYSFLGLHRVWYQAAGLDVTQGTTTHTTTTTSTSTSAHTTTSHTSTTSTAAATDYTPYIYGGIIVVIIVIIAVALARRRGGGGT